MRNWPATARACLAAEPAAMITLAAIEGSTPREAGARMIVTPTQAHGTVGGGNLEFLLIDQARRLLGSDLHVLQQDYPLGPLLAQCCGGHVRALIERFDDASETWLAPADESENAGAPYTLVAQIAAGRITRAFAPGWPRGAGEGAIVDAPTRRSPWARLTEHIRPVSAHLYVFGAGHVGRALVHIAQTLPFRLHWHDTRAELADTDPRLTVTEDLLPVVDAAPAGSFFVILTHAHELDYQLTRAILRRNDSVYCGLIGSTTKRARFLSRLARDGVDAARLTCPLAPHLLHSKLPAAIAVAASTDLLQTLEAQAHTTPSHAHRSHPRA